MSSYQAVLIKLAGEYKKACLDPFLDDFCFNILRYLTDAAASESISEKPENVDIRRSDSFAVIQDFARRELVAAGEFKIFDISVDEKTCEKASRVLDSDSRFDSIYIKVRSTIDGCESDSSMHLFYEMHRSLLDGTEPDESFTDFQKNLAAKRFKENGWKI